MRDGGFQTEVQNPCFYITKIDLNILHLGFSTLNIPQWIVERQR